MSEKNPYVEGTINEARNLGDKSIVEQLKGSGSELEPIGAVLPSIFDADGNRLSNKELQASVEEFCHRQKLGMLSHSIGLGLGVDFPQGHRFKLETVETFLRNLGIVVRRDKGLFKATVEVPGGVYHIEDTDRHAAAMRALHFRMLRHDPDTDEFVRRNLMNDLRNQEAKAEEPKDDSSKGEGVAVH